MSSRCQSLETLFPLKQVEKTSSAGVRILSRTNSYHGLRATATSTSSARCFDLLSLGAARSCTRTAKKPLPPNGFQLLERFKPNSFQATTSVDCNYSIPEIGNPQSDEKLSALRSRTGTTGKKLVHVCLAARYDRNWRFFQETVA